MIQDQISLFTKTETLCKLEDAGVPSGSINSVKEALNHRQTIHRKMVREIEGSSAIRTPILFDTFSLKYKYSSPKLGQHTKEIKEKLKDNTIWNKEN